MSLFLGDRSVHKQLEDWLRQSSNCLCTERSPKKSDIRGLLEKYPTFGREKETGLLGALDT